MVRMGLLLGALLGLVPSKAVAPVRDTQVFRRQWLDAQRFAVLYRAILRRDSVRLTDTLALHIVQAADHHGISRRVAMRLVWAESRFLTTARGQHGEIGLMQLMPATARRVCGLTPAQAARPQANLDCGFRYLAKMQARYPNNPWLALVAYNQGPRNADAIRAKGLGYPERILNQ